MIIHCFFEQSGTFKNAFKKFDYTAYDYDILNNFGQTDFQIDIFNEIDKAYSGDVSIFDSISKDDLIFAFFPCTRFEHQILLSFKGEQSSDKNKPISFKLKRDIKLHNELNNLYCLVTKLVLVCYEKSLKLIIENPYSTQHYLYRYWALKPSIIDIDRSRRGDFFKKPTQFYFVNFKPKNNFLIEPLTLYYHNKVINKTYNVVERSLISQEYAERFIKEFIL